MSSTTRRLYDALLNADNLDMYLDKNAEHMEGGAALSEFLEEKLNKSGLTRAELFMRSGLNPSYGYQLLSGLRSPARDTAIQLALGLALDVDDTQRLLRTAKLGALYPRDRRDSVILFAVTNGFTLTKTNELLTSHSMSTLSR